MKKLKSLLPLMLAAVVLFSSCDLIELLTEEENLKPQETFDKTLTIDIPEEYDKKETFLIFTNTGEGESYIGRNASKRSAASGNKRMTVYKGVTNMGGGYYRDEVVFNKNYKEDYSRAAGSSGNNNQTYRDLDDNKFFACVDENINFEEQSFTKKYDRDHCRIWYWGNTPFVKSSDVSDDAFSDLGDKINSVFLEETEIFGSNAYNYSDREIVADENTKLDILVYDLFGDASSGQQSGTFGFFYSNDFRLDSNYSNKCEAIHIDSYFLKVDIEDDAQRVTSTIVHEFQHLLNHCNKNPKRLDSDVWYNEMLSMCAEDIFQNIIGTSDDDSPKSRFNGSFNEPYQGFVYWPDASDEDIFNAYGNAYAFGAYLMRNYGGVNLIHQMATNNWVNEESVTQALKAVGKNKDFMTVMKDFGYVYLLDNRNSITLNKKINQYFNETKYILEAIDLNKYYFPTYNSRKELENDISNLYIKGEPQVGSNEYGTLYGLYGPRIFRTSYKLTKPIRQYGFAVYYLGKVYSDEPVEIPNPGNNIEYQIVTFE